MGRGPRAAHVGRWLCLEPQLFFRRLKPLFTKFREFL